MTLPPDFPDAPFGDDTDEALSAFLDGELSAFAAEHGTTAADARDRLERWPGFADRVAALEPARAVAGTPVPPLDDLTRHRLVRAALPAPSRGGGRTWLTAAAAVVMILLVAGIVTTLVRSGDDGSRKLSSGSSSAPVPRQGDLGDVGDVTDPTALRALLDPAAKAPSPSGERSAAGAENDRAQLGPTQTTVDPSTCARQIAGTRPVRFVGHGTYRGRPVVVVGITAGRRTIVLVVPADDCTTVLTSVSR